MTVTLHPIKGNTLLTHIFFSLVVLAPLQLEDPLANYREAAIQQWESDIQALEKLDREQADPPHAVLFLGSSSIRRWEDIASDMAPWPCIRRGYGGARFSDLAVFIERLVNPHQYDALVVFVGNDIAGKDQDKSPQEVLRLVKYIVNQVRIQHAEQPIFLIAITPTGSRFAVWEQIKQVNALLADYCRSDERLHFIETAASYLDETGKPNDALFVEDRLHLNRDGYRLWARLIKAELAKVLPQPASK
jgi:lysophospholipase L1-like esterase